MTYLVRIYDIRKAGRTWYYGPFSAGEARGIQSRLLDLAKEGPRSVTLDRPAYTVTVEPLSSATPLELPS